MDGTIEAGREGDAARQRLTELSHELARRTSKDELREVANEQREKLTQFASAKTDEVVAKAREIANEKVSELKDKVDEVVQTTKTEAREKVDELKETAAMKTHEMKEKAVTSPGLLGLIGGLVGAQIGASLARVGYFSSRQTWETDWPSGRGRYEPPVRERLSGATEDIKENINEKASELGAKVDSAKESVSQAVSGVREKIPSADEVKTKVGDAYTNVVENYPWALALGAIGFGMAAAMLLPETDVERRSLAGLKERSKTELDRLGGQLEKKIGEMTGQSGEDSASGSEGSEGIRTSEFVGDTLH